MKHDAEKKYDADSESDAGNNTEAVVVAKTKTTMHGFDEWNEERNKMLVMAYAELAAKKNWRRRRRLLQ